MSQPLNNQTRPFELGFYNFVDSGANPLTGEKKDPATVMKNMLEVIELADQVGLDVFAIGEHHRVEYLASAPEVILGAAAARTKNIRLSTAVTVLSSDDPVRVFQRFATVDLISNGRAEIMAGRGSFIESFPLFGYNLNDYDGLFDEKLRLLSKLNESTNITWSGNFRAPLNDLGIYPRPVQEKLPIWVAVGGTPESVVRAASMGLPMALAIIGGMPERFAPYLDLYRQASAEYGFEPDTIPLSINSHGFIADTAEEAVKEYYPIQTYNMNKIGRERGWAPATQDQLEKQRHLRGSDFVGTPDEIIEKILFQYDIFKHQRFLMYMGNNAIEHKKMMHAIELFGTKVAPTVRKEIEKRRAG
ncbi:MAG TPA: LLM class flavin-dependent oxidoreductase [Anaerolineales bacterium]|nr:LLM class flavin-dependent oxidoreductase [Anaerolineales bacterium]HNF93395.1 LLM class flavin-dependent oxidoreductase [Anaerolineales bacterium]HNM36192.1 LLM class flavin-dependent oxidoreductase [Anaerolineales bacterium]HNO93249.1 LLM class flavin-dependent oxidoreductase [Anaerolineales bacterium]